MRVIRQASLLSCGMPLQINFREWEVNELLGAHRLQDGHLDLDCWCIATVAGQDGVFEGLWPQADDNLPARSQLFREWQVAQGGVGAVTVVKHGGGQEVHGR